MKKLLYNVYDTISDRKYLKLEKKMMIWEYKMSIVLNELNWKITEHVTKNDALIIDFIKLGKVFNGNIGIRYEDIPNKITFSFYVAKYFDENNYRYYLGEEIFKNKEILFFENGINEFTKKAIEKYDSWKIDDIKSLGEKNKIDLDVV